MGNYFDIKRDTVIISQGGFFCQGCLIGKPMDDQSPDPRYCVECYEFLCKEAELVHPSRKPSWVPKQPKIAGKKVCRVVPYGAGIMSTLESKKITVDIIQPSGGKGTHKKRGPKHRELPEDLIRELADGDLGAKAIAAALKRKQGIIVSYKTIQRVLAGRRVMV